MVRYWAAFVSVICRVPFGMLLVSKVGTRIDFSAVLFQLPFKMALKPMRRDAVKMIK